MCRQQQHMTVAACTYKFSYLLGLEALQHLQLDGQPVTVPAGDIAHALAPQQLVFHDKVLQNLVQRVANVEITCAGGVGWRRGVSVGVSG